jgi:hypothetical protein
VGTEGRHGKEDGARRRAAGLASASLSGGTDESRSLRRSDDHLRMLSLELSYRVTQALQIVAVLGKQESPSLAHILDEGVA